MKKNMQTIVFATTLFFGTNLNAQNVGIGTATPTEKLEVSETGNVFIRINSNNNGSPGLEFYRPGVGNRDWRFINDGGTFFRFQHTLDLGVTALSDIMILDGTSDEVEIPTGELGINMTNPDDELDVVGTAHVSEYLKVGNPATPTTSPGGGLQNIMSWTSTEGGVFFVGDDCAGNDWATVTNAGNDVFLRYDNQGARSREYIYTPWAWIPAGATFSILECMFDCSTEDNFDGVFVEYSTGGAWTKLDYSSGLGNYPDNASGTNTACTGADAQTCWNGAMGATYARSVDIGLAGTWIRFRFVGFEDGSIGTGEFNLYGFSLFSIYPGAIGGAFSNGSIYAENNVYAGSNVLLGDVAEYFPILGTAEPGDLVSIYPGANDKYIKTKKAYDSNVIGIYSTNPTLTINNPNSGVPIGLTGRVPVNVTGETGVIEIGDYITASSSPGRAMRADKPCYIVGRALERFDGKGTGKILCLLENGWYNPTASGATNVGSFEVNKGSKEIVIVDPSVNEDSKIFVSMLGDLGVRHWVSKKENGKFKIELSGSSKNTVPFDYFVQNTNIPTPQTITLTSSTTVALDKANAKATREQDPLPEGYFMIPIPQLENNTPPSTPPNPEKPYTTGQDGKIIEGASFEQETIDPNIKDKK